MIERDDENNGITIDEKDKWYVNEIAGYYIIVDENGMEVNDVEVQSSKAKQNALLMSKSQELLAMLKKVLEINKHHKFNGHLINEQIEQLIKQLK